MTALVVASAVLALAVWAEIVLPGRDAYHAGWFNVGLLALVAIALWHARKAPLLAAGAALLGVVTIACGLLAPDNRTIVGAPGQRVRVDDLNASVDFPIVAADAPGQAPQVTLDRPGRTPLSIGPTNTNAGTFALKTVPRDVVEVEARDARGAHLTVTQPAGVAFLSPVLLMQQRQTISGMNLPYDSFAVPAAHRIVKAVLFSPQQVAMLRGLEGLTVPAVLLAVDDENDRPIPHAIGLAVNGQSISTGGLSLRVAVFDYPAVVVMATPSLIAAIAGTLLVVGGAILAWRVTAAA